MIFNKSETETEDTLEAIEIGKKTPTLKIQGFHGQSGYKVINSS